MNAKRSREIANDFLTNRDQLILSRVNSDVQKYAKQGKFEFTFYSELYDYVKKELERLGFKVTKGPDDRDGDVSYKIEW